MAEAGDREALTQLPIISQRMLDQSTTCAGQRTCAELGVCQNLPIPCLLCEAHPWPEDEDTLTTWEQIGKWIGWAAIVAITIVVVVGGGSYSYYKWFAQ